jgi:hypothetical protein
MNIQAFGKKQFYFLFFTNFETLFFVFIFSYSFSGTYSAPLDQVLCFESLESETSSQK